MTSDLMSPEVAAQIVDAEARKTEAPNKAAEALVAMLLGLLGALVLVHWVAS
jgi:hypothetical protein